MALKIKRNPFECLIFLLIALLIAGCSTGNIPLTDKNDIQTSCLNGVTYYLFSESAGCNGYGYMAPKLNPDGSVDTCKEITYD